MLLPARIAQGVRDGSITLAFRRWEEPRVKAGGTQLTSAGIVRFDSVEEVLDPASLSEDDARAAGFPDAAALRSLLYPPAALRDARSSLAGSSGAVEGEAESTHTLPEEPSGGQLAEVTHTLPQEPSGGQPAEVTPTLPEERSGAQRAEVTPTLPEERSGAQRANASRRGPRASKGGDHVYRVRLSWVGEDPRVTLREDVPDAAELATLTAAVAKLDTSKRSGPWTRQILEWIRDNPGVISTELAALLGREVPPMKADIRRLKALGLTESLRIGYRLSPRGRAYLESLG